jgi:hypothetical protein
MTYVVDWQQQWQQQQQQQVELWQMGGSPLSIQVRGSSFVTGPTVNSVATAAAAAAVQALADGRHNAEHQAG